MKTYIAGEPVLSLVTLKSRTTVNPFTAATLFNPTTAQITIKFRESQSVKVNAASMSSVSKGKYYHVYQTFATTQPGLYDRHIDVDGTSYDSCGENTFEVLKPLI